MVQHPTILEHNHTCAHTNSMKNTTPNNYLDLYTFSHLAHMAVAFPEQNIYKATSYHIQGIKLIDEPSHLG